MNIKFKEFWVEPSKEKESYSDLHFIMEDDNRVVYRNSHPIGLQYNIPEDDFVRVNCQFSIEDNNGSGNI